MLCKRIKGIKRLIELWDDVYKKKIMVDTVPTK